MPAEEIHDQWARERRERKAELTARVDAIAAAMGGTWKQAKVNDEHGHWADIEDGQGHGITFNNSHHEGRYVVRGNYPEDEHGRNNEYAKRFVGYNGALPSITVDRTRSPEAIAKDIARRFMPEYLRVFNGALEQQKKTTTYFTGVQGIAQRLHAACPGSELQGEKLDKVRLYRSEGGYFNAECFDDRVNFEIRGVTPEKAEAIIRLMMAD